MYPYICGYPQWDHVKGGAFFISNNQFDETPLMVHIIIVLVDESYFGNKEKRKSNEFGLFSQFQ